MSTFMKNPQDVERKWYIVDAADKPLGKVAAQAATILMGKHRPDYTPMWIAATALLSQTL